MEYANLGKTGLRVSRICLGFMSYGDARWNGWAMDIEESLDLIKKAYDAGINFFDTANVYSNGKSEEILGKAIKQFNMPRDRIVVATKVYFPVREGYEMPNPRTQFKDPALVNRCGLSRKHVFDACDASLKRLGLDYIDLYQIHRFDKNTPIEETMEALHDLVKSGKVRYIGASSMHAWEFQKANHIAEKNGWTKFISMQNLYNLLYREEEREVIPYSLDAGIGGIPWSPLAFGVLACKNRNTARSQNDLAVGLLQIRESDQKILDRLVEVAEKKKASPAQIALAWLLSKPFVTAPIVGITKAEYLDDAVGALKINLTEDECQYLEEPYAPRPLIPM
ncbi:hypothetical protein O0I10_008342 [Lichtheimia ornata]|uniref:NADP-dependent oxidoreductase domain-containing protein n=1 Tax=Lichtheimia ornata TaxID=688661 RepID=A0AAD7UYP8_9FUNG|nr:uncharacterized protein O0I10_008342 [Lichtheimia ornata]KAJ8655902.1 hypothetical protein O0I10_008342 [Lichtheimia ornata]